MLDSTQSQCLSQWTELEPICGRKPTIRSAPSGSMPLRKVARRGAPDTALTQVRHDIDSSVDFAVFAGDKLFGLKGGI
jgi:hypothetical protein